MTTEREARMKEVAVRRQAGFVVVLEDIHDPHNAAAILRTCDAFGVQDVYFIFEQEKAYNPRQVGKVSSSSANRWLSFKKFASSAECLAELKGEGFTVCATSLTTEAVNPYEADLTQQKIALVVGNEHRGVSEVFQSDADIVLTIPMRGFVESLNVSVAAALCIAEITRQRKATGDSFASSEAKVDALLADWQKRNR